jgi:hypothetical protein
MASRFSSAKNSIAECDRCGFRYKLTDLKTLVIKTKNVNIKVCPECWEPDQPQLQLGLYPVNDPQAVRDPRPDISYYEVNGSRVIEWGWNPVGGSRNFDSVLTPNSLVATGAVGTVIARQTIVGSSFELTAAYGYDDFGDTAIGYAGNDYYFNIFGTAAPNTLLGHPINSCYDQTPVGTGVIFQLSGFTSDPGRAFFNTITCNGVTLTSASATNYSVFGSPDGIAALWVWTGSLFNLVSGQTYTVTLG